MCKKLTGSKSVESNSGALQQQDVKWSIFNPDDPENFLIHRAFTVTSFSQILYKKCVLEMNEHANIFQGV